jgi:hypothetical protein
MDEMLARLNGGDKLWGSMEGDNKKTPKEVAEAVALKVLEVVVTPVAIGAVLIGEVTGVNRQVRNLGSRVLGGIYDGHPSEG